MGTHVELDQDHTNVVKIKYDPRALYDYDRQLQFDFTGFCNKIEDEDEEDETTQAKGSSVKVTKNKVRKNSKVKKVEDGSTSQNVPNVYDIITQNIEIQEQLRTQGTGHKSGKKSRSHKQSKIEKKGSRQKSGQAEHKTGEQYSIEDMKPNATDYKVFASLNDLSAKTDLDAIDKFRNFDPNKQHVRTDRALGKPTYKVWLQDHLVESWYMSPYTLDGSSKPVNTECGTDILYICEYCFHFTLDKYKHHRHSLKCTEPNVGECIYNDTENGIRVYEMDGLDEVNVARNLCLFSKLFLNSKTLYFDVEPFLFYLFYHENKFFGYFSKEKISGNNLSCILTNPVLQKQQWGQYIIRFSYLLSSISESYGSPEKPLSDLGLLAYRKYWKFQLLQALLTLEEYAEKQGKFGLKDEKLHVQLTLEDLSVLTGMVPTDIVLGLEQLQIFYSSEETNEYKVELDVSQWKNDPKYLAWAANLAKINGAKYLNWVPPLFGPSGGINTQVIATWGKSNELWTRDYLDEYLHKGVDCASLHATRERLMGDIVRRGLANSTGMSRNWKLCHVEYTREVDDSPRAEPVVRKIGAVLQQEDYELDEEVQEVLNEPLPDDDDAEDDQSFSEDDFLEAEYDEDDEDDEEEEDYDEEEDDLKSVRGRRRAATPLRRSTRHR